MVKSLYEKTQIPKYIIGQFQEADRVTISLCTPSGVRLINLMHFLERDGKLVAFKSFISQEQADRYGIRIGMGAIECESYE